VPDASVAVLVKVPPGPGSTVTVMVYWAKPPAWIVLSVHVGTALRSSVQPLVEANVTPAGRVSVTTTFRAYSLDAQVRAFRSLAEARNWQNCREYLEQGKSGHVDDVGKRPVFKEVIDDAALPPSPLLVRSLVNAS